MSEAQTQQAESPKQQVNCFCMGAGPELFSLFKKFGPESALQHFRNARIEMLKGMRALIDHRIQELSAKTETKGTKVPVE